MQKRNSILTLAFVILANVLSFACIKPVAIGNDLTISTLSKTSVSVQKKPSFVQKILLKFLVQKLAKAQKMSKKKGDLDEDKTNNTLSIFALIFGIVAVGSLISSIAFAASLSIITIFAFLFAILFGAVSLNQIRKNSDIYGGKKMAMIGLLLGLFTCIALIRYIRLD